MLIEKQQLSTKDCVAVLEKAKNDFLAVMNKLSDTQEGCSTDTLKSAERVFVVHYLEAVVILRHLQRPGVAKHFTVSISVLFWSALVNFPLIFESLLCYY